VLYLFGGEKILSSDIPYTLRESINHKISAPSTDWLDITGRGLAEYIVQEKVDGQDVVNRLTDLREIENQNEIKRHHVEFVRRLIALSNDIYWIENPYCDELKTALDGVIQGYSKYVLVLNAVLDNMSAVEKQQTGSIIAGEFN
jgi:hypothetical protein